MWRCFQFWYFIRGGTRDYKPKLQLYRNGSSSADIEIWSSSGETLQWQYAQVPFADDENFKHVSHENPDSLWYKRCGGLFNRSIQQSMCLAFFRFKHRLYVKNSGKSMKWKCVTKEFPTPNFFPAKIRLFDLILLTARVFILQGILQRGEIFRPADCTRRSIFFDRRL